MLRKERRHNTEPDTTITRRIVQIMQPPAPLLLTDESKAVVELLRKYLKRAEAGTVSGVCITASVDGNLYDFDVAGTYAKYPADALGPLEVLKLQLARKALDG